MRHIKQPGPPALLDCCEGSYQKKMLWNCPEVRGHNMNPATWTPYRRSRCFRQPIHIYIYISIRTQRKVRVPYDGIVISFPQFD